MLFLECHKIDANSVILSKVRYLSHISVINKDSKLSTMLCSLRSVEHGDSYCNILVFG